MPFTVILLQSDMATPVIDTILRAQPKSAASSGHESVPSNSFGSRLVLSNRTWREASSNSVDVLASRLVFEEERNMRNNNLDGFGAAHGSVTTMRHRRLHHSATQKAAYDYCKDINMAAAPHAERRSEAPGKTYLSSENITEGPRPWPSRRSRSLRAM